MTSARPAFTFARRARRRPRRRFGGVGVWDSGVVVMAWLTSACAAGAVGVLRGTLGGRLRRVAGLRFVGELGVEVRDLVEQPHALQSDAGPELRLRVRAPSLEPPVRS